MFRTARRFAPRLGSMLFGAASAAGLVLAIGSIAGCAGPVAAQASENQPATPTTKVRSPGMGPEEVSRAIQQYEDKLAQDRGDRSGPAVKALLDTIVQPMTEACTGGGLDEQTNSMLIKLLADTRDPRAEACIVKALEDYKPEGTEEDVRAASRYVSALRLKSAAAPMFEVFTRLHAAKPKGNAAHRDVHDAMIAIADPAWEAPLIASLGRPVNVKQMGELINEMFWQITAAELLGIMRSSAAVRPLIKVLLSPAKGAGQMDAIYALLKIGKPVIAPTVALLEGQDKELVDYSKDEVMKAAAGDKNVERAASTAHVGVAALILATIGREDAAAPLLSALARTDDGVARAIIARELSKVPRSAETVKAFRETFEKLPVTLSIPNSRGGAREVLLEVSVNFFDASFVPWILKTTKEMKGSEEDLAPIREAALAAAMKIMRKEQIPLVDALANQKMLGGTVGKGYEKEYKICKEVLSACGDQIECYLAKLAEPASQTDGTQLQGIKAVYMIGVLGAAGARGKIVDALPKITHPAVRFASVTVLDALSPKGDVALAKRLQRIVDEGVASGDRGRMRLNAPFKQVIYRLNARAQ